MTLNYEYYKDNKGNIWAMDKVDKPNNEYGYYMLQDLKAEDSLVVAYDDYSELIDRLFESYENLNRTDKKEFLKIAGFDQENANIYGFENEFYNCQEGSSINIGNLIDLVADKDPNYLYGYIIGYSQGDFAYISAKRHSGMTSKDIESYVKMVQEYDFDSFYSVYNCENDGTIVDPVDNTNEYEHEEYMAKYYNAKPVMPEVTLSFN